MPLRSLIDLKTVHAATDELAPLGEMQLLKRNSYMPARTYVVVEGGREAVDCHREVTRERP